MAKKIADNVRKKIKVAGHQLLDEWRYLNRTTAENSKFMDQLCSHSEIGGKLAEHLASADIRKYVKDVIVNSYSKKKRKMPRDVEEILQAKLKDKACEIDWKASDRLSLHRLSDGTFAVVARATYVKWETGLRKLLLYITNREHLRTLSRHKCRLILAVFEHSHAVNGGDKALLVKALETIGVSCYWGT